MALNLCRRTSFANALCRQSRSRFSSSVLRFKDDPFLMPNTPEHEARTRLPDSTAAPTALPRLNETIETTRARLVYQSRKRGTLETDLLLSTFAKDYLKSMPEAELRQYDKLLDELDWDIYYWATQRRPAPERWANSGILKRLQQHTRNEGKAIRRMPDLS